MFKKILIANRGEIALRIMATCAEMGISTVAVFSEADRQALHVRQAHEAYCIGPAPATESYLRIATLLDVARASGAEAIHPGYGFLSENAAFAAACAEAGIVFIGPSAAAMRLMGSKISAKQLARSVGVATVPGNEGESQDEHMLQQEAQRIGFPLLIKASAGGGGKGMRIVHRREDFLLQLASAQREAEAAFGDGTVFLERLIMRPRHVEIQILGDKYGNYVHLGERECSIQRRHQKIVEESPSVALHPALREEMGAAAVRIAQAAHYENAGTLEFVLDTDLQFYFLEMNTRLQVEHPVTELVTGLDLVRHQLRIAAGEPLSLTQHDIRQRGHAIEVRIYAEDPQRDFLPATGRITQLIKPSGPGVRVDSGIESGDEVTPFYDSLLAKLIVSAEDRPTAIARLRRALEQSALLGVTTNLPLLHTISTHAAFQAGHTHTNFLEEQGLLGTSSQQEFTPPPSVLMAAALYELEVQERMLAAYASNDQSWTADTRAFNPWSALGPWSLLHEMRTFTYSVSGQEYKVSLKPVLNTPATWQVQLATQPPEEVTSLLKPDGFVLLRQAHQQRQLYVHRQDDQIQIALGGRTYTLQRRRPPDVLAAAQGRSNDQQQRLLKAPMAGTVAKVEVHDGQTVQLRQVLVILSAMKMEHAVTAPYEGTVQHVHVQEGATVAGGAPIIEIAPLLPAESLSS